MKQYGDTFLTGCSSHPVMGNELLLCEILTRVPVKSLMRFRCVCKQWDSLIHTERSFIDLHFRRKKTCDFAVDGGVSLLLSWPRLGVFSSAELILSEGGVTTVEREISIPRAIYAHAFGAVNGLICFAEFRRETCSVCVFNPSTGESTPWIQSMIKQQHEDLREEIQVMDEDGDYVTHTIRYTNANWYYFGYDPATKEHKVVIIWFKRASSWLPRTFETICEVMTVDGRQRSNNLLWRGIDDKLSLPPTISPFDFTSILSANGCIYWLRTGSNSDTEPLVIEFNVGSEKYRVIPLPNYIIEEIRYPYVSQLITIDGRLAVLAKKISGDIFEERPDRKINNSTSMKMCVLYENSATTSTSSAGTASNNSDFYWIEETFMMPPFDWNRLNRDSILAVPGTDSFIIRSEGKAGSSFYFYDWRKKSFSKDEQFFIKNRKTFSFVTSVYKESLLPVM